MLQLPGHDCAYNLCHQDLQLYSTCVPSDPSVKLAVCTTKQFNSQYVAQTDKMLCQTKFMDFQTGLVYIYVPRNFTQGRVGGDSTLYKMLTINFIDKTKV